MKKVGLEDNNINNNMEISGKEFSRIDGTTTYWKIIFSCTGKILKESKQRSDGVVIKESVYLYNKNNKKIEEKCFGANGKLIAHYKYHESGKVTNLINKNNDNEIK